MTAKVDTKCLARTQMESYGIGWLTLDALVEGTNAMRKVPDILIKLEKEDEDSFKERLALAFLFNGYGKTLKSLSSKPFAKPVIVKGELHEQLEAMKENVDGQGTKLSVQAKNALEKGIHKGVTYLFVDYPKTLNEKGETPNKKEEQELGLKPRIIHLTTDNIYSWKYDDNGNLSEVRFYDSLVEEDGQWGEKLVDRMLVCTTTGYEDYRRDKDSKGEYVLHEEGTHTFGEVPIVPVNLNPIDHMTAKPCLNDLAEVNVQHYQSAAEQRLGMKYARFPLMSAVGLTPEEVDAGITIGVKHFLKSTNPEAKFEWVEHTGAAFETGFKDLERLEMQMEILGLQPLVQNSGNQTATGKAIDQANHESDMQAWVRTLESSYAEAFKLAAKIINQKLPEDFEINIFNEFSLSSRAIEDLKILQADVANGLLSKEQYYVERKRRGIIMENVDIEEDIKKVGLEGPDLNSLGINGEEE